MTAVLDRIRRRREGGDPHHALVFDYGDELRLFRSGWSKAGLLALAFAFGLESPSLEGIAQGWVEILYAGVLSTAVAFTLQAIGQQYVPPANAAIILSAESLFAALGGAVVMGERLPFVGYFGAALIFFAILLVEALPALQQRRTAAARA